MDELEGASIGTDGQDLLNNSLCVDGLDDEQLGGSGVCIGELQDKWSLSAETVGDSDPGVCQEFVFTVKQNSNKIGSNGYKRNKTTKTNNISLVFN